MCVWGVACSWLRPYPNGSLPNVQIRMTLVDLLVMMNLDTSNDYVLTKMSESGLGKVMMFYSQNHLETNSKHQKDEEEGEEGQEAEEEGEGAHGRLAQPYVAVKRLNDLPTLLQ